MFFTIISSLILIYICIAIFYSSYQAFTHLKSVLRLRFRRLTKPNKDKTPIRYQLLIKIIQLLSLVFNKNFLHNLFYLNSHFNKRVVIYGGAISIILLGNQFNIDWDSYPKWFLILGGFVPFFIVLYGIGKLLSWPDRNALGMHMLVVIIFSISFLQINFEEPINPFSFSLSLFIPIIFTFIFFMNVIKNISNLLILICFLIMNLCIVYFCTGLLFGNLYFINQDLFQMYSSKDYTNMLDNSTILSIINLIHVGLVPFFSYPKDVDITNILSYVPLGEFLLGTTFNTLYIGFLISYLVAKFSDKQNDSLESTLR